MQRQNSNANAMLFWLKEPCNSMTTGMNSDQRDKSRYFVSLQVAENSAALPSRTAVDDEYKKIVITIFIINIYVIGLLSYNRAIV